MEMLYAPESIWACARPLPISGKHWRGPLAWGRSRLARASPPKWGWYDRDATAQYVWLHLWRANPAAPAADPGCGPRLQLGARRCGLALRPAPPVFTEHRRIFAHL